jgi:predicted RNase H-like nuclease
MMDMAYVVGIDGCRGAWISVSLETDSRQLVWNKLSLLSDLLEQTPTAEIVGIDIPIGLPEKGPRACDLKARRLLGKRGSSVFPAPILAVLEANSYREACKIRLEIEGKRMSQQAWAIVPKVREVHLLVQQRADYRSVLHEVHPEVSFYYMGNKKPNSYSKKRRPGIDERIEKLSRFFEISSGYITTIRREHGTSKDDILDALAALWSAERILQGKNTTLGEDGDADGPKIYA